MAVTLDDLKQEMKAYDYEIITAESDAIAVRALVKGRNWIKAKISGCADAVYDEDDETVHEILLKRACYELYLYNNQEGIASDKKNDAYELLRAKYGACIDSTNQEAASGSGRSNITPGASIVKRERNTEAF